MHYSQLNEHTKDFSKNNKTKGVLPQKNSGTLKKNFFKIYSSWFLVGCKSHGNPKICFSL